MTDILAALIMREGDQLGDTGKPSGSRRVFRLSDKTVGKKICSTCEEERGVNKEGTQVIYYSNLFLG